MAGRPLFDGGADETEPGQIPEHGPGAPQHPPGAGENAAPVGRALGRALWPRGRRTDCKRAGRREEKERIRQAMSEC